MHHSTKFWDELAPRHAGIEENFLSRASLRHIIAELRAPVHVLRQRECLETYLLSPAQMIKWVGERAHVGRFAAAMLMLRLAVSGTLREKMTTLRMQRVIRGMKDPQAFIQAAPEYLPYRNEAEIRNLFLRLSVPINDLRSLSTCRIAQC